MSNHKIIYYYQTFTGLSSILYSDSPVTHIHLSAVHFGNNPDGTPYIHLNNYPPENSKFDTVWDELAQAKRLGIKIVLMLGGAGSAYTKLFQKFDIYYPLLVKTIKKYSVIDGIDLDIEEYVSLDNIKMLITKIDKDFGKDFIISMAPVQGALQRDISGLGGFVYKDLYKSPLGKRINYFNGQFYNDYSVEAYRQIVQNGYPEEKVVMGMISSQNFQNNLKVVRHLSEEFSKFGGVYNWEYFNSPPKGKTNPGKWAYMMKEAIEPSSYCYTQ